MFKRFVIVIILLVIVFGGIFGWDAFRSHEIKKGMANYVPPPSSVSAVTVKTAKWTPTITAIGSLTAYSGVDLLPQQSGMITEIYFHSGEIVQKGQKLIKQDTAIDEQELKNYEAQVVLAVANYKRSLVLHKKGFLSDATLDEKRAALDEALANKNKTQEVIAQKTVRAPFAGKAGIRKVSLGQYVSPSSTTPIVNLQKRDPLRLLFSLPQQKMPLLFVGQPVKLTVPNYPKQLFDGKITALDSTVNQQTRNILVQANVPNKPLKLSPGMYANIEVLLPVEKSVLTIPQIAVAYSPYGDSVFLIKKETKKQGKKMVTGDFVTQVLITLGDMRGSEIAVVKGLKAGDRIVSGGQLKLRNGAKVVVLKTNALKESSVIKTTGPS
jgi:membrane fusion protein, multidrug efflux system